MIEITTKMAIKTSADRAYEAFVSADRIGKFWFSESSADWIKGADIILSYKEFDAKVPIHIEDLRENEKILLTWGTTADERAVTMTFTEEEAGLTMVEIREQGFQEYEDLLSRPELAEIRSFEYEEIIKSLMGGKGGWTFVLTCLKAYLEHDVTDLREGLLY